MLFLRLMGRLLLLLAFIALAYDGACEIATPGRDFFFSSAAAQLHVSFPLFEGALQRFFNDNGLRSLWSAFVSPLLALPPFIVFGALGSGLFMAGYRRPPPEFLSD